MVLGPSRVFGFRRLLIEGGLFLLRLFRGFEILFQQLILVQLGRTAVGWYISFQMPVVCDHSCLPNHILERILFAPGDQRSRVLLDHFRVLGGRGVQAVGYQLGKLECGDSIDGGHQCVRQYNKMSVKSEPSGGSGGLKRGLKGFYLHDVGDEFLIETETIKMQIEFKSPIKEIAEFMQQYQKYDFKAKINSTGIRVHEYEQIKDFFRNSIEEEYKQYMKKSLNYLQELLINMHFMKMERWHYYKMVIEGYNRKLLIKDIDCYGFNISQFDQMYKKAMQYLSNYRELTVAGKAVEIKAEMRNCKKQIFEKEEQILKNMFVVKPFKAQNVMAEFIDSSELFYSFINKVLLETDNLQSVCFPIKANQIGEKIKGFFQQVVSHSLKAQKIAQKIIKNYNIHCETSKNEITEKKFVMERKEIIDADEVGATNMKREQRYPVLINKSKKISFDKEIRVHDLETKEDQIYETNDYGTQYFARRGNRRDHRQDLEIYFVPPLNQHFDFWEFTYEREKLRKIHLFWDFSEQNHMTIDEKSKKIMQDFDIRQRYRRRYGESDILQLEKKGYASAIQARIESERKIWANENRLDSNHADPTLKYLEEYVRPPEAVRRKAGEPIAWYQEDTKKKVDTKQIEERHLEQAAKFQKERKSQQQYRLVKAKAIMSVRTYPIFASDILNMKDAFASVSSDKISRYGIEIFKDIHNNKDYNKLEEFLFYYFKERMFRENQIYADKASQPLLFSDKPASKFCSKETIQGLRKPMQTKKWFIIWGSQIIKFEEFRTPNREMAAKFSLWTFSDPIYGQSLLFELKRRTKFTVVDLIYDGYIHTEELNHSSRIQMLLCKVELIHRLVFNLHMEPMGQERKIAKGMEIYEGIISRLEQETKANQQP